MGPDPLKCLTWTLVLGDLRRCWPNGAPLARACPIITRCIRGLLVGTRTRGGLATVDWLLTLVESSHTRHLLSLCRCETTRVLFVGLHGRRLRAVDVQSLDGTVDNLLGWQVVVRLSLMHARGQDGLAHGLLLGLLSDLTAAGVLAED